MTQAIRFDEAQVLHLAAGLGLEVAVADADFWREKERPELASGRLLSIFSYDATWDYQERHPDGEELVLVLEGEVDLLLDVGDGEQPVHLDRGEACLVPEGAWHRASVQTSCTMLFITPVPARTEHRSLSRSAPA